ncbi:hypothetical protein PSP6_490116 [Paraburkholderia tropica]|nr:hypothetical protein PSP6_490116 [Paraburkholderia tropica]
MSAAARTCGNACRSAPMCGVWRSALVAAGAACGHEGLDVADRRLALIECQMVDRRIGQIEAQLLGEPAQRAAARLEDIDLVAPHFGRDERFERVVQTALGVAQRAVGETAERHVARATRGHADPRFARGADPERAVIVAIRIGFVAETREQRLRAAVVAERLRQRLDRTAYAHGVLRKADVDVSWRDDWDMLVLIGLWPGFGQTELGVAARVRFLSLRPKDTGNRRVCLVSAWRNRSKNGRNVPKTGPNPPRMLRMRQDDAANDADHASIPSSPRRPKPRTTVSCDDRR